MVPPKVFVSPELPERVVPSDSAGFGPIPRERVHRASLTFVEALTDACVISQYSRTFTGPEYAVPAPVASNRTVTVAANCCVQSPARVSGSLCWTSASRLIFSTLGFIFRMPANLHSHLMLPRASHTTYGLPI